MLDTKLDIQSSSFPDFLPSDYDMFKFRDGTEKRVLRFVVISDQCNPQGLMVLIINNPGRVGQWCECSQSVRAVAARISCSLLHCWIPSKLAGQLTGSVSCQATAGHTHSSLRQIFDSNHTTPI